MDLTAAVDELYACDPADFVSVRTRLAAAAKDAGEPETAAELRSLRKPTAVAGLLNRVVRAEPDLVTDLLALGDRMRTAQAKGDGAALAAARPERQAAIDGLVAAARRAAESQGARFGPAAADDVVSTAVAVLADPAGGQALSSGRLLRPLAYAGFGEVELDDAVALLRLVPPVAGDAGDGPDAGDGDGNETARERELAEARDSLREHERDLSAARLAHSDAVSALEAATDEVERLEAAVALAADRVTDLETRPGDPVAADRPEGAGS